MSADALKSVDTHFEEVLAGVSPLGSLDMTLSDAHGCVLDEDVVATFPLPPFDNAATDGYAVRTDDVRNASVTSPTVLPVVGDVLAGSTTPYTVQPGLCVRIMTGAPIPPGADAVVAREDTDGGLANVAVRRAPAQGHNIRIAGDDAVVGTPVLTAGAHLGATQIGLLAAVGRDRVMVRPRPRVVVLSTGVELVEPGMPLGRGQIPDSNSALLTTAAQEAGAIAFKVGIVADEPNILADTLEDQLIRADMVLTTGGVSVGTSDVVKEVLSRIGSVRFDQLAIDPVMPVGFGAIGPDHTPFFGLPGNPVSAYIAFEVFVRPALRRMIGVDPIVRPTVRARLGDRVTSPPGRRSYLRGSLNVEEGAYVVRQVGGAGSHLIAALAAANSLIVVPESVTELDEGAAVTVMLLERRHH